MLKRFKSSVTFLMKLLAFLLCGVCFFGLFGLEYFFLLRPSRTLGVTAVAFIVVYVLMTKVYGGFDIGKRKTICQLGLNMVFHVPKEAFLRRIVPTIASARH